MPSLNTQKGSTGENLACGYLEHSGYKIVERNIRTTFGEIDIIAISPDKSLVIVEVKTVYIDKPESGNSPASYPQESGNSVDKLCGLKSDFAPFTAETHMNKDKINKTIRMATWYINRHADISKNGCRIDLIAIDICASKKVNIRHYKNVVER